MPLPRRRTGNVQLAAHWALLEGTTTDAGAGGGGGAPPSSAPTFTLITPSSGISIGGTAITVGGTGFIVSSSTVSIGGINCTSVVVTSGTTLTAVTPAGAVGAAAVQVWTSNGTSAVSSGAFTYTNLFTISGNLTDADGGSNVSGGRVRLYTTDATPSLLTTVGVSTTGGYSIGNQASGPYWIYVHPGNTHGLASTETGYDDSNITAQGQVVVTTADITRHFSCVSSFYDEDFQSYANTLAMKNWSTGAGGTSKKHINSNPNWVGNDYTSPGSSGHDSALNSFATISLTADFTDGTKTLKYGLYDN